MVKLSHKLLGICIGFIVAKTNIHVWMLETMFQHVLGISMMLDMMFHYPDLVQYALFVWLGFHTFDLFKETTLCFLFTKYRIYV